MREIHDGACHGVRTPLADGPFEVRAAFMNLSTTLRAWVQHIICTGKGYPTLAKRPERSHAIVPGM